MNRTTSFATIAGGLVFAGVGYLQLTNEFGGTHNTLDSTAEYVVTGGLTVGLSLTVAAWRRIGELAGDARTALIAIAPQLVLALMCLTSVINGADLGSFNAVAPVCLLTWLISAGVLARGLRRTGAMPAAAAFALPALLIAMFPLSPLGGPVLAGAYWIAFALTDGFTARRPVLAPQAA